MKKNYHTPMVSLQKLTAEDMMALTVSGEYDEKSNAISWDSLADSLGL